MAKKKNKKISKGDILSTFMEEVNEGSPEDEKVSFASDDTGYDLDLKDAVSSDIPLLDFYLGGGFYPGRLYEVFGEESHGKSTLTYHWMARLQQDAGGKVILAESETAIDKDRAHLIGADPREMIIFTPESVEDCFDRIARYLAKFRDIKQRLPEKDSKFPIGIFWDTIASAPTQTEVDYAEGKSENKWSGGKQEKPRLIREWLRSVNKVLPKSDAYIVLVNQVYESTDNYGNKSLISPGGRGIRHHASGRIFVKRGKPIVAENDRQIGFTVDVKIIKCKQAPTDGKTFKVDLYFSTGYDPLSSIVHYVFDRSLVEVRGSWIVVDTGEGEPIKEQGVQNLTQRMKTDDRLRKILEYRAAKDIADMSPVIRKRYYEYLVQLASEVGEEPPLHEKWDLYAREFKLHMSKAYRQFITIEDCLSVVLEQQEKLEEFTTTHQRNKFLESEYKNT